MTSWIGLVWALAVFVGFQLTTAAAIAADPAAANAVKVLLDKGWEKTKDAKALANHEKLDQPPFNKDSTLLAARWLVQMYQNSYDDAQKNLEAFLKTQPADDLKLAGLRATAWIQTVRRNYSDAMKSANALALAVGPDPAARSAVVPLPHAEAIEFLGHLAGFLEGPAERNADQNLRKKFEAAVLARFDEPRKKIFSDAKAEVLSEYQKLVGEAADAKQESKDSAEATRQQKLEKLSDESQRLSSDAAKLADEQKQLRDEYVTRMAALEREDVPLRTKLLYLQNQFTVASNSRVQMQRTVDSLQGDLRAEKDNVRRQNIENDLRQAQNNVRAAELQVINVNGQMQNTQGMRMMLQKKANDLIAEAKLKGFQLDNQIQDLDREKLKNDSKQKKAEKAKASPSSKALARETEARAFTTYDTFPLEELRETLLSSVK